MVWMYGSLGIVGFVAGCVFWVCFRKGGKWAADAVVIEAVQVEREAGFAAGSGEGGEFGKGGEVGKVV